MTNLEGKPFNVKIELIEYINLNTPVWKDLRHRAWKYFVKIGIRSVADVRMITVFGYDNCYQHTLNETR